MVCLLNTSAHFLWYGARYVRNYAKKYLLLSLRHGDVHFPSANNVEMLIIVSLLNRRAHSQMCRG